MKKIFLFLILGIFMISFTSAFNWTNTNSYHNLDDNLFTDSTFNLNDGTNTGTTNTSGILIDGRSFSGSTFINISNEGNFDYEKTDSFSIQAWIKTTNDSSLKQIVAKQENSGDYAGYYMGMVNGKIEIDINSGTVNYTRRLSTPTYNDGNWHHIVMTYNGNDTFEGLQLYIDGAIPVSTGSSTGIGSILTNVELKIGSREGGGIAFIGDIDEVGIWNRTLNQAEITELYNSGNALTYAGSYPKITLLTPTNGTTLSDVGTNFTVSGNNISDILATWDNLTYYVYQNGTIFNQTTISLSSETFNETLFIDSFMFEDYEWNAEACYTNITGSYCVSSDSNNTFSVSLFTIISEYYVSDTVSGTLENFSISIDLLEGYSLLDAGFIYNGTDNSPSITAEGDNRFLLVSNYQIPILATDKNISFYWNLTFTGNILLNSTERTQLVRAVLLDDCSVYTNQIFNISLFDEKLKTTLLGDIEITYTLLNMPNYQTINTYSFEANNISNIGVCSGINLSEEAMAYSAEIRYVSDEYAPELYHIQRSEVGSEVQSINLFDLNSNDSTEFKVTYQDDTFNFIEGAIVQLQRKYISEGIYEVVEAPLTSRDGVAVLHIDLNSNIYKATVVKNGEVLDVFDNLVFKCQSELTGECEQKLLGAINPQNEVSVDTLQDFYYELIPTDDNITITFSIPSGAPSSVNILMVQKDEFGNKSRCNQTIISSSGSITCSYSETLGDSYIELLITKNGVPMATKTYLSAASKTLDWLGNNYIFILVILFSLTGMALTSPEWIIINGILTMVISGGLFLAGGLDFVMGLGAIMWLIIAAIILISKISKQEDR